MSYDLNIKLDKPITWDEIRFEFLPTVQKHFPINVTNDGIWIGGSFVGMNKLEKFIEKLCIWLGMNKNIIVMEISGDCWVDLPNFNMIKHNDNAYIWKPIRK